MIKNKFIICSILSFFFVACSLSNPLKKEAKVINDDIQIRQIMYATLSADHRVGDGAEGALLMKEFKELLEKPSRLLL